MVIALPGSPKAVPPSMARFLLQTCCMVPELHVCSLSCGSAQLGSVSAPGEMKRAGVKGCWGVVLLSGTTGSLLLSFIGGREQERE